MSRTIRLDPTEPDDGLAAFEAKLRRLGQEAPDLAASLPAEATEDQVDEAVRVLEARSGGPAHAAATGRYLRIEEGRAVTVLGVTVASGRHFLGVVNTIEGGRDQSAALPLGPGALGFLRDLVGYPNGELSMRAQMLGGEFPAIAITREGMDWRGQPWAPLVLPIPPSLVRGLYEAMVGGAAGKLVDVLGQAASATAAATAATAEITRSVASMAESAATTAAAATEAAHARVLPAATASFPTTLDVRIVEQPETRTTVERDRRGNMSETVTKSKPLAPAS